MEIKTKEKINNKEGKENQNRNENKNSDIDNYYNTTFGKTKYLNDANNKNNSDLKNKNILNPSSCSYKSKMKSHNRKRSINYKSPYDKKTCAKLFSNTKNKENSKNRMFNSLTNTFTTGNGFSSRNWEFSSARSGSKADSKFNSKLNLNCESKSRSKSKFKPNILQINIKDMMRDIINEEKENLNNDLIIKNIPKEYVDPKFNKKVEELLNYSLTHSFDLKRSYFKKENLKNTICLNSRHNSRIYHKKADTNLFFNNENLFIDSPINSLKKLNQTYSYPNNILSKSLPNFSNSNNLIREFNKNKIFKTQIKFSYLYDLVEINEKRKKMIDEKKLAELFTGVNISNSKSVSKSKSKNRPNKFNKTDASNKDNKKTSENSESKTRNQQSQNNYLTSYFINKKNKLLEDILSKTNITNESKDEKVYRNSMKWLHSVNENKVKLENKIKNEMKITDQTERILKGFPKNYEKEEQSDSIYIDEALLNYNSSNLINELTKKNNFTGNKISTPKIKKGNDFKVNYFTILKSHKINTNEKLKETFIHIDDLISSIKNDVHIIESGNYQLEEKISQLNQLSNQATQPTQASQLKTEYTTTLNTNYLSTVTDNNNSDGNDSNIQIHEPYVRKSIPSIFNVLCTVKSEKNYDQRIKEMVSIRNIETIILEKKQKCETENTQFLNRTRDILERYKHK